ncbi:MAG TPA: helix-hairpin-helix domain-containing protein [Albitalea sp.]
MLKKVIATLLALWAAAAFAAVDINKASVAELDAVKGIGPAAAARIVDERKKGPFRDWSDVMQRVRGIKEARASRLSEAGLTVNGQAFRAGGPKKADKPAPSSKLSGADAGDSTLARQ